MNIRPYEFGDEFRIQGLREKAPVVDTSWAFTVQNGDKIVAVVGCSEFYKGTGHLWAHVSEEVRGKGFSFTKSMRKLIIVTLNGFKYKRLQAFAYTSCPENGRWLKSLGLHKESTMKSAFDGEDVDVYARIL